MCRNTLSVGWDGRLYDCDFNQMLELDAADAGGGALHIRDFDPARLRAALDRHRPPLLRLHRRRRQLMRRCRRITRTLGRVIRGLTFVALFFPALCASQAPVVDAAGREIRPPAKVERVYAAGPPASLLVFAIAPDKLVGWTRAMRPNEAPFFPDRYAQLPELGRLTGRGNTANVEVVLNAKTDLIVDVGSTGASLASLATQVQEQTKIPYALFDGRMESTPATLRALGRLMGNEARGGKLAAWYENELNGRCGSGWAVPRPIPWCITAAAFPACRPAAKARSTSRSSTSSARAMRRPKRARRLGDRSPSSRSCCGIPK